MRGMGLGAWDERTGPGRMFPEAFSCLAELNPVLG